LKKFFKDIL